VCVPAAGENASELQRCSRYVVKLAGRLDATLQAVHTIYTDRKRRAVDRLLAAYVQVCGFLNECLSSLPLLVDGRGERGRKPRLAGQMCVWESPCKFLRGLPAS
jgi:hypothetical protein